MSLFKKLKDVLFEEEEYTEPIKIREEKKEEPMVRTSKVEEEVRQPESFHFSETNTLKENEIKVPEVKKERVESERELFRKENSFEFPSFDEEEFQSNVEKPKSTNVLEYERKRIVETKNERSRYERVEKEVTEKKKFKPSPIISPVYGILNQDYKAEDITFKNGKNKISFEEVRKKAFEPTKEVKEEKLEEVPKISDIISEPVVTFFDEKDNITVEDEKSEKEYKTINDLLESASDEIPLEDTLEIPKTNNLDVIEEELEKIEEEKVNDKSLEDTMDTTKDNELFELIDSMYDEREEG